MHIKSMYMNILFSETVAGLAQLVERLTAE